MIDNYRPLQDPAGRKILFNPTLHQFDVDIDADFLIGKPNKTHWQLFKKKRYTYKRS
jgi:hypothetical protein